MIHTEPLSAPRLGPDLLWLARAVLFAALLSLGFGAILLGSGSSGIAWLIVLHSLLIGTVALCSMKVPASAYSRAVLHLLLLTAWLQNCATGLLDLSRGPIYLPFRNPASEEAVTRSSLTGLLFVLCISLGWFLSSARPARPANSRSKPVPSGWLVVLGIMGLLLRFPSLGSLSTFLSGEYGSVSERATGLLGFASSVLRPMLAVGLFCMYVDAKAKGATLKKYWAALLSPLAFLAVASFALNRAAIVLPLAAMLIAYHVGVQPIPLKRWLAAGFGMVAAFISLGIFRTQLFNSRGGRYDIATETSALDSLVQAVQLYAQSPFLTGVLFEPRTETSDGFGITSLVASAVGPVPALGETFRDVSGTAVYNQLIYGRSTVRDQIIPVWAELERSTGLLWMCAFAFVIGALMKRWGSLARPGTSPFQHYAVALGALWLSQVTITSIQALSQVSIYFLLPLAALSYLLRDTRTR